MTDRYAVIGNPVSHSQSPFIHAEFARACAQSVSYDKLYAELGRFNEVAQAFFADGGCGLNITLPFKGDA